MNAPEARLVPRVRAALAPWFRVRIDRTEVGNPDRTLAVPSVDPSSIAMISTSFNCCAWILWMAAPTHCAALKHGTITERKCILG